MCRLVAIFENKLLTTFIPGTKAEFKTNFARFLKLFDLELAQRVLSQTYCRAQRLRFSFTCCSTGCEVSCKSSNSPLGIVVELAYYLTSTKMLRNLITAFGLDTRYFAKRRVLNGMLGDNSSRVREYRMTAVKCKNPFQFTKQI